MRKRPRLTADQVQLIIEHRERGLTMEQIARKVGCSQGSVNWLLLKQGVDIHENRVLPAVPTQPVTLQRGGHVVRRFTQAEDLKLLDLEKQGLCMTQIGRELGRRPNSIVGRLRTLARRAEREELQAANA